MAPIQIFVDGIATPLHGANLRTSLLQTVGVHSAQIDQTLTSVIVSLDESVLSLSQLRDKIVSCGFKINSHNLEDTQIVNLKIKFMTCNSCVTTITDVLMSTQGVLNAHIDLDSETGRVTVVGISPEEVANVIEDCGFEASVLDEHHRSNDDNDKSLTKRAKVGPQNPFINQGINKPETFSFELKRFKKNSTFNVIPSSKTSTFHITGMTCGSCVSTIEKHLNSRREIVIASVNLTIDQATVEYIETLISEREIIELIDDIGFEAELIELSKYGEIDLQIFGMTCASCSGKIERELGKLNGVESITVNLLGQSAHICFNEAIGVRGLIEKIESLGFNALIKDDSAATQSAALSRTMDILQWRRSFMLSLLFSIPVMIIAMVLPKLWPSFPKIIVIFPGLLLGQLLQMVLTAPLQFGIGWRFYVAAYKSLSHGSYTMDVLVTLGTSLSYGFSVFSMIHSTIRKGKPPAEIFFSTSAMLITFITFGRYLENVAKAKTSNALSKLISLAPSYATLLEEIDKKLTERKIPSELIQVSDLLKIFPGERVPVDGIVEYGESSLDESLLTGEPFPVSKKVGDQVITGSVNTSGVLHVRAVRVGDETTVSQIVKLVSQAQSSKAPIQASADRVASIFVPTVVFLGVFTFILWMYIILITGWIPSSFPKDSDAVFVCLSMCISVIVAACPCALGLATPTAVMVGTGVGASLGILIKGGGPLSIAPTIKKIIFDKTGTLTYGKMELVDITFMQSRYSELELLEFVVVTESNSEHPIGKSIIQQICIHNDIKTEGISVLEFKAISGSGVTAKVTKDGTSHIIAIGNLELMDTMKCSISIHQRETISDQQYLGHTVVVAAIDDSIICIISLADKIRPEAKRVIKALTKMGISSCMVTGDCLKTAQIIAEKCGISEVYASISPAGKRAIVLNFQDAGLKVAMVGDGVNDSASLAQSDLGIAVFGGTDVAIESASVVLMRPDLTDIVTAIDLSRTIYKRICFNFIWASGYNVLMIPLAMGAGAAWGFTLPAMASGMAMSFSSVSVLVSSLLLQYYRKPQIDLDGLITRPLANLNPLNEDGPLMASDFSKDGIPELRTEIADSTTALL